MLDQSPLRLCHHYCYILFCGLVTALILYVVGGISFVDALVLGSGAATQSGLNPVDMHRLHLVQQVVLWVVPMVTNVIFVNTLIVLIRLYWFRKRFQRAIHEAKEICRAQRRQWSHELARESMEMDAPDRGFLEQPLLERSDMQERRGVRPEMSRASSLTSLHITFYEPGEVKHHKRSYSYRSQSQSQSQLELPTGQAHNGDIEQQCGHQDLSYLPSLVWQQSIASYSGWNERQKEELGGIEYRALKTLLIILVCYFVLFHLTGLLLFIWWAHASPGHGYDFVFANIGVNRFWWAVFTADSAFNNLGYTLTPNSMEPFKTAPFALLLMTFLVVIGNTGFPCMLRFIIWVSSKATSCGSALEEELQYLLDHPRRCFTLLFPSAETWRLTAVLLLLNAIDLAIFWALETNRETLSAGLELVNGLFQIASTRTAGFSIMPLSELHPGVQVSFVAMMYISAFPTAITMRKTNIYEERSLAIYDNNGDGNGNSKSSHHSLGLVGHIQHQLGFDLWYVMLGFFTIAVAEGQRLKQDPDDPAFALFPVLFEIVSAYGTVGLSLGYPGANTSLCGQFTGVSKLVIIAMQLRGRHRGLPDAVDHAILLPSDGPEGSDGHVGEGWRSTIGSFFSRESNY